MIKPNRGFDIEAAHKAVARIEDRQGWQREQHGRYQVKDDGEFERAAHNRSGPRPPEQAKCDMEQRTGEKSAERIAIEVGAPIIKAATSWQELHQALAKEGLRYERVGSGAVLFVNEVGVKASSADRQASLGKLEKRLGAFEPSQQPQVAARPPEPVQHDVRGWTEYIKGRRTHTKEKEGAWNALKQRQEAERMAQVRRHRTDRAEVLQGRWKGRGELRNALESILAAKRAGEQAALREQQRKDRASLRERYRPYPDLEQWLRQQEQPDLAEEWRYRANQVAHIRGGTGTARPRDIRDYTSQIDGDKVRYTARDKAGSAPETAFVDKGREIDIHAWRERASVLAALQLAEQKWESFDVSGRTQFKSLCVELAVEHGFKINNPELQAQIAQEKQRQLEARAMPRPAETSPTPPSQSRTEAPAAPLSQSHERSAKAYARHYRDVVQRQAGKVTDLSRVDAMIAVRLRATGHTQQQVESALRLCAPMMHPKTETRDWSNYAQCTAAYAFGAAGQRQGEELKKYWDQWQRLEARPEETVQERGRGRSR